MRTHIIRHSFNPGAKFIILFINPNVYATQKLMQTNQAHELFRLMYDRYNAANVLFLYTLNGNDYNIYVTNPYQNKTHCGKLFNFSPKICNYYYIRNYFSLYFSISIIIQFLHCKL